MEEMFDFLDDYFQKTPKEVIKAKFDKYNQAKYEGISLKQYLQDFAKNHNFLPSLINFQKEKSKKSGISVYSEQIQETVSPLPITTKAKVKQEIHFAMKIIMPTPPNEHCKYSERYSSYTSAVPFFQFLGIRSPQSKPYQRSTGKFWV